MLSIVSNLFALKSDRRAVTAMEYALIAGLVAVVIVGAVTTLGTNINNIFTSIGNSLQSKAG